MKLKQITKKDQLRLKEVYFDSVNSIDNNTYSKEHKFAWASQAWENSEFQKSLLKGKGLKLIFNNKIIGFATRYPENRLSLLYVRGNFKRKGFGTIILDSIERDALNSGINKLKTEASLISYGLLLKRKWEIERKEIVNIKGLIFERYRMFKIL
mgnify:CR=1 FL=1|tara:strand:- start:389 stop:850 length:462 start_codon:yes stop_codon:yes gene_type:complete